MEDLNKQTPETTQEMIDIVNLPTETLEEIITLATALIKSRKQDSKAIEVAMAVAKYDERNELGKRIYSLKDVAKITGVSTVRLSKALKATVEEV